MVRTLLMIVVLLSAALALAACDDEDVVTLVPTATQVSEFPLAIEQSDGEQLTIEQAPQRVVSLSAHATEILCDVGAGDQLAAVEAFANCPLEGGEKPDLDSFAPNLEAIAGFNPDLVYVSSDQDGIVGALRDVNIPVLFRELPTSIEGVLSEILLFGRLSGHAAEAEALVQSMQERLDAVSERVAEIDEGPRIYHELDTTYFSAAPQSFIGGFYTLLKAENIAADAIDDFPQLSAEVIIDRDPEVIILADEAAGVTAESVAERPGWSGISAVVNERICVIDPDIVSRPGPRIVEAVEALAECLYPELAPQASR